MQILSRKRSERKENLRDESMLWKTVKKTHEVGLQLLFHPTRATKTLWFKFSLQGRLSRTLLKLERSIKSFSGNTVERENGQFFHSFQFSSNMLNSNGHYIVFPNLWFFWNFIIRLHSAANFVPGKWEFSEKMRKRLKKFVLVFVVCQNGRKVTWSIDYYFRVYKNQNIFVH